MAKIRSERVAIKECKRLWKEIEESGLSKRGFLKTKVGGKWRKKNYISSCPLCEYDPSYNCHLCPLVLQYDKDCTELCYYETPPNPQFFEAVRGLKE